MFHTFFNRIVLKRKLGAWALEHCRSTLALCHSRHLVTDSPGTQELRHSRHLSTQAFKHSPIRYFCTQNFWGSLISRLHSWNCAYYYTLKIFHNFEFLTHMLILDLFLILVYLSKNLSCIANWNASLTLCISNLAIYTAQYHRTPKNFTQNCSC